VLHMAAAGSRVPRARARSGAARASQCAPPAEPAVDAASRPLAAGSAIGPRRAAPPGERRNSDSCWQAADW
jgi:hypothetical protein